MRYCACERPLPSPNPRSSACNRCGFNVGRPKPEVEREPEDPIRHHCARCQSDLSPGQSCGLLYTMAEGMATESMVRFCPGCLQRVLEFAVTMR